MFQTRWLICAAVLLLAGAGCGRYVAVGGVVTLDGKPLDWATVTFTPVGGTGGYHAHGITDENGFFQLTSLKDFDGAEPGEYKITVTIAHRPPAIETRPGMTTQEVMALYGKAMAERKKNPPPPLPKIPAVYGDVDQTPLRQRVPPDGRVRIELHADAGT